MLNVILGPQRQDKDDLTAMQSTYVADMAVYCMDT